VPIEVDDSTTAVSYIEKLPGTSAEFISLPRNIV
jgi:hypothetical protein